MSVQTASRRQLLHWALAAAAPWTQSSSAWSQNSLKHNPFSLGVASGSPNHNSVVLWTRLMPDPLAGNIHFAQDPVSVHWEISDDENFKKNVRTGQVLALPELAHSVHLELQNLPSDHWFFYRFRLGDAHSSVGRTRTFPHPEGAEQQTAPSLRILPALGTRLLQRLSAHAPRKLGPGFVFR